MSISNNQTQTYEHKQVRKLTDNQKVEIAIQKEIRPTPTTTNVNIAAQFGVSKDLVNRINPDSLNPQQKLLFEERMRNLKYDALELTSNSIKKANDLVNKAENASHLGGVVAAMGKANEIYRLETNQSTANINIADCAQIAKQAFEIQAKLAQADQDQTVLTQAEKIAIYEEICLAQGQQPDVSLLELDGEETE